MAAVQVGPYAWLQEYNPCLRRQLVQARLDVITTIAEAGGSPDAVVRELRLLIREKGRLVAEEDRFFREAIFTGDGHGVSKVEELSSKWRASYSLGPPCSLSQNQPLPALPAQSVTWPVDKETCLDTMRYASKSPVSPVTVLASNSLLPEERAAERRSGDGRKDGDEPCQDATRMCRALSSASVVSALSAASGDSGVSTAASLFSEEESGLCRRLRSRSRGSDVQKQPCGLVLIFRNLPYCMSPAEFGALLGASGRAVPANVWWKTNSNGLATGVAVVTYNSLCAAVDAHAQLDGMAVYGRTMTVEFKRPAANHTKQESQVAAEVVQHLNHLSMYAQGTKTDALVFPSILSTRARKQLHLKATVLGLRHWNDGGVLHVARPANVLASRVRSCSVLTAAASHLCDTRERSSTDAGGCSKRNSNTPSLAVQVLRQPIGPDGSHGFTLFRGAPNIPRAGVEP